MQKTFTKRTIQYNAFVTSDFLPPALPGQNGRHIADYSSRRIFMTDTICILS